MTKILLVFVLNISLLGNWLFIDSPTDGTKNCSRFKRGTFRYKESSGDYVIRKKKVQLEYSSVDNILFRHKITWVNDCEYILTFVEASKQQNTFVKDDQIRVLIIETGDNCFTFKATFKGIEFPATILCKDK